MAEVVVIHDAEDRAVGDELAREIERAGTSVELLTPGRRYLELWRDTVAAELEPAKAMVLVWSRATLHSATIELAARLGLDAGKLVIVRSGGLEHEALPQPFLHFRSVSAGDWDAIGDAISAKFTEPEAMAPREAEAEQPSPQPTTPRPVDDVPSAAPATPTLSPVPAPDASAVPAPQAKRFEEALTGPGSATTPAAVTPRPAPPPVPAAPPAPSATPAATPPRPSESASPSSSTLEAIAALAEKSRKEAALSSGGGASYPGQPPAAAPALSPAKPRQPAEPVPNAELALDANELQHLRGEVTPPPATPELAARPELAKAVEDVDCSVFAPPSVRPGNRFLIQIYLHTIEQMARVTMLAGTIDASAEMRGTQTLQVPLRRDAMVTLTLEGRGLEIGEPRQTLRWTGRPSVATFDALAPFHLAAGDVLPVVRIAVEGRPVGRIVFAVGVEPPVPAEELLPAPRPVLARAAARRYGHAFLSYATPDRAEVLKRAQAFKAAGLTYFQDILSLSPGDRYTDVILENIDRSDLFVVFWSTAASQSEWVTREIDRALEAQRRSPEGLPDISPIVLDHAGKAPLPAQIAHLHVNDVINYVIAAEEPSWWQRLMRRLMG